MLADRWAMEVAGVSRTPEKSTHPYLYGTGIKMTDKLEGRLMASGLKMVVLVARFNQFVTDRLLQGALELYTQHGGDPADTQVVIVPGAYEMPLAAQRVAASGRYDAIVALAAVVRGETPHFEYVSGAAAQGLSRVSLDSGVPIGFGVLTTDTMEQAIDRAGAKAGNKGAEAMRTAIEMANLLKILQESGV